jgi:hypothetical protein
MWSAHGPWLCLKCDIYIYYDLLWSVPKWSSHFAVYISRHSQLQNPRSCSSGSTIPCTNCVQRRKRRCSSESEIRSVQVSFNSMDWFKEHFTENHRIYQSGVSCPVDFTLNRFWDLQMEKWGTHTAKCQCWGIRW